MANYYTTKEEVHEAIASTSGNCEIIMLKHIHDAELEASARTKANSLNLRLAVIHLVHVFPDLIRYQFYGGRLESLAVTPV